MNKVIYWVLWAVFYVGLILALVLWQGYAFSIVWKWFVMPVFDLRAISVYEGAGLAMIIGYLTTQTSRVPKEKEDKDAYLKSFAINSVLLPPTMLLIGWILKAMM